MLCDCSSLRPRLAPRRGMWYAVLITEVLHHQLVLTLLENNTFEGDADMIAISHFVPSWILKVKPGCSSSGLLDDKIITYLTSHSDTVQFVVSQEDLVKVSILVSKIEPLSHHLLPGWIVTCESFNANKLSRCLEPFTMLENCLSMLKYMQPPPNIFHIPVKQLLYANQVCNESSRDNSVKSNLKSGKGLLVVVMHLPQAAITFLIGGKGHSINKIRQQTSAAIKIYPEGSNVSNSPSHEASTAGSQVVLQRVEIAASTGAELAKAQQLVFNRLSLRKQNVLPGCTLE